MNLINLKNEAIYMDVVKTLNNGGLVMHPTETCYGLAVDIFNEGALRKLYKVKGMAVDKPVSILVDSFTMAGEYGIFSDKAFELAEKFWPGPLSIIVPRKRSLPDYLNENEDFVSIRCSSDDFCNEMIKAYKRPVTTTSANRAGEEPFYSVQIPEMKEFTDQIDLIVDGGELLQNKPSTIVKVEGYKVEIIRQGDAIIY